MGRFGPLYKYGVNVLNEHSPSWFVAENVGDLKGANDGHSFRQILRELERAGDQGGYVLTPTSTSSSSTGSRGAGTASSSSASGRTSTCNSRSPRRSHTRTSTTRLAIGSRTRRSGRSSRRTSWRSRSLGSSSGSRTSSPGRVLSPQRLPEHLRLNVTGATISQIYKRLERDKPSYTVTGSGGGGRTSTTGMSRAR